jgi:hypothetical protein
MKVIPIDNQSSRAWWALIVFSGVVALTQLILTIRLVDISLLNSYPFTSSDSYDWLLEGYAFSRWVEGAPLVELPVLRNPVFVITTFLDYLLGGNGYLVLVAISGGLFLLLVSLVFAARWASARPFESTIILWFVVISPLAYFRPYILSDLLATALMTAAAALLIPYHQTHDRRWLVAASVMALVAGLTQVYGVIPFAVISGWLFLVGLKQRQPDWYLGAALPSVVLVAGLVNFGWRMAIPHDSVPRNWSLLDLSTAMADFYSDAWTFAFGAMLPVIVLVVIQMWKGRLASPLVVGTWLAVVVLLVSNFLYQWEDFRLTLPASGALALALVLSIGSAKRIRRSRISTATFLSSAVLMTFVSLSIAPASYWTPSLGELQFSPQRTWMGQLLTAEPVDRFEIHDHCGAEAVMCEAVPLPPSLSPYQRAVLSTFKELAPD